MGAEPVFQAEGTECAGTRSKREGFKFKDLKDWRLEFSRQKGALV